MTTLKRRFDFERGARADLLAFKKRLEERDLGERIRRQEKALASNGIEAPKSVWTRLGRLFHPLRQLNRTRSRIEALEREVTNLRKAVIDVVETETASLVHVVKNTQRTAAAVLEQVSDEFERLSVDVVEHYDRWTADYARNFERAQAALRGRIDDIDERWRLERLGIQRALFDLERQMTLPRLPHNQREPALGQMGETHARYGSASVLETFYAVFDERYGLTDEVREQRFGIYRNDLNAARDRTGSNGPIIDIRCGRGEFLEFLRDDGFQAIGIDTNDMRLDQARRRGVAVAHADAVEYLRAQAEKSAVAIVGISMAERLSFMDLVDLIQEASRVLRPGGIAIFETPNPRNLVVSATTFYLDPMRIRPLPPEVMQTLLETVGFRDVIQRPLNAPGSLENAVDKQYSNADLATLICGPEDYAIMGVMR